MKEGRRPAVTLVSRLDYTEEVLTDTAVRLVLQHAAGRLRRALAISLQRVSEATKRRVRKAG